MSCNDDATCGILQQCIEGSCVHNLIFPISAYTGFVYATIPFFLGLGMLGGLGGGILKGPVLMMMLNYSLQESTFISYALVFGGCLLNTAQIVFIKHPDYPNRPIIDYNLAMITNCAISLGSNIGSMLNILFAQFYLTIFQEIFLLCVIPYLWIKGQQTRQNQLNLKKDVSGLTDQSMNPITPQIRMNSSADNNNTEQFLNQEGSKSFIPIIPCIIIFGFFALTQIMLTVIPALFNTPTRFPHCFSLNYLLLIILTLINPFLTYLVYLYGRSIELKRKLKRGGDQEQDIFVPKMFLGIYGSGMAAGIITGLLGLGAGLVMVPSMLHFGVKPRVASATSAFNYMFIALTNLITLTSHQLIPAQVAYWFGGLALVGGSLVTKIGYIVMEKYNLSYQVILIVIGLAISNLVAGVWYLMVYSDRFGFKSLLKFTRDC